MEPEKDLYRIQYVDNTYQYVSWTEKEFEDVTEQMDYESKVIVMNKCIFKKDDIRAIVYIPVEEQSDTEKDEELIETTDGTYTQEMYDLLVNTGLISPAKGGNE